jgi:GTP-binding protein
MVFVDIAQIEVWSGNGGPGAVNFRHEKHVPRGGPDGGDGGNGGDVSIVGDPQLTTLQDFRYRRQYRAKHGERGLGSRWHGSTGDSVTNRVPCGTLIYDDKSGELLADIVEPKQTIVVAKGGLGGRGNAQFATPTRQAPDFAQPGNHGDHRSLRLELKLLADVGLVGVPNAGKSTLLSVMSAARPKIADYPFTTLVPNLGIVDLGEHRSCVMADIPGLIEGAHQGKGLGDQFLRHIERTRVLVFLVESTDADPKATLKLLRSELGQFNKDLLKKPWMYALSKSDLADSKPHRPRGAAASFAFSAVTGAGLDRLRFELIKLLDQQIEIDDYEDPRKRFSQNLPTEPPQ